MAWVNGGRYYYRNRREGGRVVREYVGMAGDPVTELEAEQDAQARQLREAERLARKARQAEAEQIDGDLDQAGELARALVRASLLLAGYHPHERTWRRRRYD